jgi:hypothetical protein
MGVDLFFAVGSLLYIEVIVDWVVGLGLGLD